MMKKIKSKETDYFCPKVAIDKSIPTPIYYQIVKSISEEVSKNCIPNNTPLASERFITKHLGVNRRTIRKAYRRLVSEGIIRKEGRKIFIYRSKKNIGADTFNTIGLVLPMDLSFYIQNKFWLTFDYMTGIMDASRQFNCSINLISFPALSKDKDSINEWLATIKASNINGLIYLGPRTNEKDPALDMLMMLEIPRVFAAGYCTEKNFGSIRVDEKIGIQAGAEHLMELGHERIGVVGLTTKKSPIFRFDAYYRMETIVSVLKQNDIEIDNKLILKCKNTEEEIKKAVEKILEHKNPPTAIMCYNDDVALTVMKESQKMGFKIPDDLSIIGFDDSIQASESVPKLTTIKCPRRMLGKEGLRFILEWIKKRKCPSLSVRSLPTSLVIRESTGLPGKSSIIERGLLKGVIS